MKFLKYEISEMTASSSWIKVGSTYFVDTKCDLFAFSKQLKKTVKISLRDEEMRTALNRDPFSTTEHMMYMPDGFFKKPLYTHRLSQPIVIELSEYWYEDDVQLGRDFFLKNIPELRWALGKSR